MAPPIPARVRNLVVELLADLLLDDLERYGYDETTAEGIEIAGAHAEAGDTDTRAPARRGRGTTRATLAPPPRPRESRNRGARGARRELRGSPRSTDGAHQPRARRQGRNSQGDAAPQQNRVLARRDRDHRDRRRG